MFWEKLLIVICAAAAVWFCWRLVKQSPGSFTWANFNKTGVTLGVLALLLMGLIAVLVMFLQHS